LTPAVAELIDFPDIEAILVDVLAAELDVPVSLQVPRNRPADAPAFVLVRRLGGIRTTLVTDDPLVTVEAWAPDRTEAWSLVEQARAVVGSLAGSDRGGVTFYRVSETSGPTNLPDPESEQPRYTVTLLIKVRASEPAAS
jgi:hypothetical protein